MFFDNKWLIVKTHVFFVLCLTILFSASLFGIFVFSPNYFFLLDFWDIEPFYFFGLFFLPLFVVFLNGSWGRLLLFYFALFFQIVFLFFLVCKIYAARPVFLAYEYNRFRVVYASDVVWSDSDFSKIKIPILGVDLISLRNFRSGSEKFEYTLAALNGISLSSRSSLWQNYYEAVDSVRVNSRSVKDIYNRFPFFEGLIRNFLNDRGFSVDECVYLPANRRDEFFTVVLRSSDLSLVGFLPIDTF